MTVASARPKANFLPHPAQALSAKKRGALAMAIRPQVAAL